MNPCASVLSRQEVFALVMARFCCSIDTEPRTLNQGQLNFAREAAADAVQRLEVVDKDVNTPPLEGFSGNAVMIGSEQTNDRDNQLQNLDEGTKEKVIEKPCQCLLKNSAMVEIESPDQSHHFKEPLTAPF